MSATTRPGRGDRTTTRSAIRIASGMLWVTMTMVVAARSQRRSSSRSKRSRLSASSALNGSSRRRTAGSSASARASATRWAVPPDSSEGRESATAGSRPTRSISVATRGRPALGRPAGELERIGDVVGGRAPRQETRLLEDQPDARIGADDRRSIEEGLAAGRFEQAGDDAQERRLAAAVRADERDDPAARDGQVDAVEDRERAAGPGREGERQVLEADARRSRAGVDASCAAAFGAQRPQERRRRRIERQVRLEQPVVDGRELASRLDPSR